MLRHDDVITLFSTLRYDEIDELVANIRNFEPIEVKKNSKKLLYKEIRFLNKEIVTRSKESPIFPFLEKFFVF